VLGGPKVAATQLAIISDQGLDHQHQATDLLPSIDRAGVLELDFEEHLKWWCGSYRETYRERREP